MNTAPESHFGGISHYRAAVAGAVDAAVDGGGGKACVTGEYLGGASRRGHQHHRNAQFGKRPDQSACERGLAGARIAVEQKHGIARRGVGAESRERGYQFYLLVVGVVGQIQVYAFGKFFEIHNGLQR